jgi:hypothetical protein
VVVCGAVAGNVENCTATVGNCKVTVGVVWGAELGKSAHANSNASKNPMNNFRVGMAKLYRKEEKIKEIK